MMAGLQRHLALPSCSTAVIYFQALDSSDMWPQLLHTCSMEPFVHSMLAASCWSRAYSGAGEWLCASHGLKWAVQHVIHTLSLHGLSGCPSSRAHAIWLYDSISTSAPAGHTCWPSSCGSCPRSCSGISCTGLCPDPELVEGCWLASCAAAPPGAGADVLPACCTAGCAGPGCCTASCTEPGWGAAVGVEGGASAVPGKAAAIACTQTG